MEWKKLEEERPINKKVLVWRAEREKYVVAVLEEHEKEESQDLGFYWVTQHGSVHEGKDDDAWIDFPYYETTRKYD